MLVGHSVAEGVIIVVLAKMILWFASRVQTTLNRDQVKRCGHVVIGLYTLAAAQYILSFCLVCFGLYCIAGSFPSGFPAPWMVRALYGVFVTSLGIPGLFQSSAELRRDPHPVDWASEYRRLKASLRHQLGLSRH